MLERDVVQPSFHSISVVQVSDIKFSFFDRNYSPLSAIGKRCDEKVRMRKQEG